MGLPKGRTNNREGRPLGAINKLNNNLRSEISEFLQDNFEQVKADILKMDPRNRVKCFIDLLNYALPKLQTIDLKTEFEQMTDEQLNETIHALSHLTYEELYQLKYDKKPDNE